MDNVTWWGLASVLGSAVVVITVLLTRKQIGEWTHEMRVMNRATDRQTRATQNLVYYLARTTGSEPDIILFDNEDQQSA
jgi:hypothetical protein